MHTDMTIYYIWTVIGLGFVFLLGQFICARVSYFVFCVFPLLLLFGCQCQCNPLPGRTCLWNDLLCVEWDVKHCTLTHILCVCFLNCGPFLHVFCLVSFSCSEFSCQYQYNNYLDTLSSKSHFMCQMGRQTVLTYSLVLLREKILWLTFLVGDVNKRLDYFLEHVCCGII